MKIIIGESPDPEAIPIVLGPLQSVTFVIDGRKYSVVSAHDHEVEPLPRTIQLSESEKSEVARKKKQAFAWDRQWKERGQTPKEALGDILPKPPDPHPSSQKCREILANRVGEFQRIIESVRELTPYNDRRKMGKLAETLGVRVGTIMLWAKGGGSGYAGYRGHITRTQYRWMAALGVDLPPPESLLYSHPQSRYRRRVNPTGR